MAISAVDFIEPEFVVIRYEAGGFMWACANHALDTGKTAVMHVESAEHMGNEYDHNGVRFQKFFWKELSIPKRLVWQTRKIEAYEKARQERERIEALRKLHKLRR